MVAVQFPEQEATIQDTRLPCIYGPSSAFLPDHTRAHALLPHGTPVGSGPVRGRRTGLNEGFPSSPPSYPPPPPPLAMTPCRSGGNVETIVAMCPSSRSTTMSGSGSSSFLASSNLLRILSTMSTSSTSALPGIHKLILASERLSRCRRLSFADTSLWRWLYLVECKV